MRPLRMYFTVTACYLFTLTSAAAAEVVMVHSDIPRIHIKATDILPPPQRKMNFAKEDSCRHAIVAPATVPGKLAAARGWYVSTETIAAGYTAIGLFSRGGQGTSGTCFISDGNIVLYKGAQLVAIVYGPRRAFDEGGDIGGVFPTLTVDRVRIGDMTPVNFESADIRMAPDRIEIVKIAEMEAACGGISLPNIRRMTIDKVRKKLSPYGWRPAVFENSQEDSPYDFATAFRKQGLTEFETCSGTGYAFCSVRYFHPNGAVLDVTTVGDAPPAVSAYDVKCRAKAK